MMERLYPYLVAGLPELSLQAEVKSFDYGHCCKNILQHLQGTDAQLLRLMLMGLAPQQQTPYLYVKAAQSKCRFIRDYFAFDRMLRNAQVHVAAKKTGLEAANYLVGEEGAEPLPGNVKQVVDLPDVWERERKMDALRWEKASEIAVFNYLDIDYILAFVVKASIVDRWMKLDKTKGEELFRTLVTEVRGTFDIRKTTV